MTREDAEQLGWTFETSDDEVVATHDDGRAVQAGGGLPLFTALAEIAQLEGQPFLEGRGGDEPLTQQLVTAVSGETFDPEPDPALIADTLAAIRTRRDTLLRACDWTQLPDAAGRLPGSSTSEQWATYRQALCDFPNQNGFDPLDPPAWPAEPA